MTSVKYVIGTRDYGKEGVFTPYGAPKKFIEYTGQECIISGPYDSGKGNIVSSCVYTPGGPRTMGDLRVGDFVLSVDGSPTRVTGVYPRGTQKTYRVTMHDGASTVVDGDHLWKVAQRKYKRVSATENPKRPKIRGSGYDDWRIMSTDELRSKRLVYKAGTKKDTRRKYWIPTADPAQFTKRPVTIDPYVMGILIAEGSLSQDSIMFSSGDAEVVDRVDRLVIDAEITPRACGVSFGIVNAVGASYRSRLADYGLWGKLSYDKFIPDDYLYNDIDSRIDLLQGLMDGDGTVDHRYGSLSYTSCSRRLIDNVRLLVESLGGYVSSIYARPGRYTLDGETVETGHDSYTARVILPSDIEPFSLERKQSLVSRELEPRRFIDSIEYVGDEETVCIQVEHESHLYLTDRFIVTHNTLAMMHKVHRLMWTYPGAQALILRKSYASLVKSALQTYYHKVLPVHPDHPDSRVHVYGGSVPQHINYEPVGGKQSRIWLGGMDDPEKVLSSEYDFIAVPQAEELELHDWEQLLGRCNGRAGNAPMHQLMGDCNPGPPNHWILHRPSLKVFYAQHVDNPTLYQRDGRGSMVKDANGSPIPTEGGADRIKILQSLSGLRYKRGFLGLWVGAEGQVYEDFDPSVHIIEPFEIPYGWRRYRCIDFGYTHPFTCQWWAEDEDGRLYLYREMYMTRRTVAAHATGEPGILSLSGEEKYHDTICDWDAGDRATLESYGIETVKADKRIDVGVQKVQERLKVQDDGRPRIFFMKGALVETDESLRDVYQPAHVTEEFSGYVWRDTSKRREATAKDEVPVKAADHGLDAVRYMVMHCDGAAGAGGWVKKYA